MTGRTPPRDDGRSSYWPALWKVLGITVVVFVGVLGLAILAMSVLVVVALNSQGSNK